MMLAIFAICLGIFLVEKVVGWPDWLTLDNTPKGRIN
ncbi:hypothetical protein CLV88_11827 [Shimia abyssi]|uniref:Uncharacterized protein n=2 Tax=Shimia abyssi TaxID=1662395 RepID=A0A2P8F6M7_9RHOB|nr:hypothetical protein CLV88_11827 [Shimia abyssi]